MTRDFATDPEVAADLDRQARTEADRSRTRETSTVIDSTTAATWPCLYCKTAVPVPRTAVEMRDTFNRALRARGQRPLEDTAVCSSCYAREEARRVELGEAARTRCAQLVRVITEGSVPPADSPIVRELRKLGHPDVDGLLKSLRERKSPGSTRGRGEI